MLKTYVFVSSSMNGSDTTAYDKRVEQRKEKEKLKKELDKRKKEIQKKLDDEYYASKDEMKAEKTKIQSVFWR